MTASLAFCAASLAVLCAAGYGLSRWDFGDRSARLAAPAAGFALVSLLALDWMWISGAGMDAGRWAVWVAALALSAALFALRPARAAESRGRPWDRWDAAAVLCAVAAFALHVLPVVHAGRPLVMGPNLDAPVYVAMEEWARERSVLAGDYATAEEPYLHYILGHNHAGYATAFPLVGAVLHSLVPLPAWTTFAPLVALFLALSVLTVYAAARAAGLPGAGGALAAAWIAVHPLRHWVAWEGFAWQVTGWTLLPLLLLFVARAAAGAPRAWIAAGLVGAAYVSARPEELVAPVSFFLGALVAGPDRRSLLKCAAFALAANPVGLVRLWDNVSIMYLTVAPHAAAGDPDHPFLSPAALFGLRPALEHYLPAFWMEARAYGALTAALCAVCLVLMVRGAFSLPRVWRFGMLFALAATTAQVLVSRLVLDWPYGFFKLIASATTLAVLAAAAGVSAPGVHPRAAAAFRGAVAGTLLVALAVLAGLERSWGRNPAMPRATGELAAVPALVPPDAAVFLPLPQKVDSQSHTAWAALFFRKRTLYADGTVCYLRWRRSPERAGEAYLLAGPGDRPAAFGGARPRPLWSNGTYTLYPPVSPDGAK